MDNKLLLDTAVYAGEILMKNGAETSRVEDTMYRILRKSNLKTVQVLVIMTGFTVTLDDPSIDSLTVVRRIQGRSYNLEVINDVNQLSREFCDDKINLEQFFRETKNIWKKPKTFRCHLLPMAILTGGFAMMFGSNISETMIAAVVGAFSAIVDYVCQKKQLHMFLENIICSVFLAMAVSMITRLLPGTYDDKTIIVSCIMPFVPGAAITTAAFDTLHGDYLSGLAKAAEAFLIATAVAIGIGIGIQLFI